MNAKCFGDNLSHNPSINPHSSNEVIPVVKLSEKMTYDPWNWTDTNICVIKIQDLVSSDGTRTNKKYTEITSVGGIHDYFEWDGKVILSSIAPDRVIFGLSPGLYSEIICSLDVDAYITPDAETYIGEYELSSLEIERIITDTHFLREKCDEVTPIGLVKGCNINQVHYHIQSLKDLDICQFCFHSGDYLTRGSKYTIDTAIQLHSAIREEVPFLYTYGIGSYNSMYKFSCSDAFITQTHYSGAFYGKQYYHGKWVNTPKQAPLSQAVIMNNLLGITNEARNISKGKMTLDPWITDPYIHSSVSDVFCQETSKA